jgi:hypothetical protein
MLGPGLRASCRATRPLQERTRAGAPVLPDDVDVLAAADVARPGATAQRGWFFTFGSSPWGHATHLVFFFAYSALILHAT